MDLRNPAFILWVIRERLATDWVSMAAFFGFEQADRSTQPGSVLQSLGHLQAAGLLEIDPELKYRYGEREWEDKPINYKFHLTEQLEKTQRTLGFSLRDLALSDPHQRVLVHPSFGRVYGNRQQPAEVFVVMPFKDELQPVFEDHIRLVCASLQRSVARADDFFSAGRIVDEIFKALYDAGLVIADCTDRNPNVFYEIGIAHTLGRPIILITQDENDIPFDLAHIRYLKYELTPRGMKSFEEKLARFITAEFDRSAERFFYTGKSGNSWW
jgi:hypothetical protein